MQFNFTRFGRLFMKHTAENYRYYLMSTVVLFGAFALYLGFCVITSSSAVTTHEQSSFFGMLLFGAGSIFTSTIFANLGDRRKAIASLTLPASQLEKFLVGWLYSFPIFLIVIIACFYLAAYLIIPRDNWQGMEPQILNIFSNEAEYKFCFLVFMCLHAIALWGSIFFVKWHFIKTAFLCFLAFVGLVVLNSIFIEWLLGHKLEEAFPFFPILYLEGVDHYSILFPEERMFILALVPLGTAFLLWTASYFRLKEKEV